MGKKESVTRYDLGGKPTHTDHYKDGQKVGSSVERYDLGGDYDHTDNYNSHGKKTGKSFDPCYDDDEDWFCY